MNSQSMASRSCFVAPREKRGAVCPGGFEPSTFGSGVLVLIEDMQAR